MIVHIFVAFSEKLNFNVLVLFYRRKLEDTRSFTMKFLLKEINSNSSVLKLYANGMRTYEKKISTKMP